MSNPKKIASSPYYQSILQNIESLISQCDGFAEAERIAINDSQIRSVLVKIKSAAKKKVAVKVEAPKTEKDKLLAELLEGIYARGEELMGDSDAAIPRKDWIFCLDAVIDSIKRHNAGNGSRGYLDFVTQYV
jgi:hypothetical protein